ncbi:hypothetical protein [Xylophilus sp.]|uniref:hypothetical protein n=1 Tax=Xylophilus sp. TaxID=2653893 RepID=UPI0013BC7178|nr:hypothetical protein [Xylophilus sp.]KAF1044632.1 MAG: hypothetical protein GAK38_03467 [Xylophilus sp.]
MPDARPHWSTYGGGLIFPDSPAARPGAAWRSVQNWLGSLGLDGCAVRSPVAGAGLHLHLPDDLTSQWVPGWDTTGLAQRLALDTAHNPTDLEREIALALLGGPLPVVFPSVEELMSAVRMRRYIVEAARRTVLAFHPRDSRRPEAYWRHDEDNGFTLLPGRRLVDALRAATQPEAGAAPWAFSCSRATEYVMLLGIAQELAHSHAPLLERLEQRCARRAIRSAEFQAAFLREHGSVEAPLPLHYYVPGDRVWFCNPDAPSSDVAGYEGSWLIYLGNGRFGNFWKSDAPYTLAGKCTELFHWRHAVRAGARGIAWIDEDEVARRVRATVSRPEEGRAILASMMRLRGPQGARTAGGCLDATREAPRWVRPGTHDIRFTDT